MDLTLKDRDVILVNRNVAKIHNTAIYVINLDGDLMVKRVEKFFCGGIVAMSDNKAVSSDQELTEEEADRLVIVGRAVWFGRQI